MKAIPLKHSAVISRTQAGTAAFQRAVDLGAIMANPEPDEAICEGQPRSLPFHYNISARAKAGKLLGIKIKDHLHERVRLNDFIAAWMALFNEKLTRSLAGQKLINRTP